MGVCDSNNKQLYNINYSSFSRIEHVQTISDPVKDSYKFNFSDKSNMVNRKFNLKFIFYNFKVKYCISHKPSRDSIYITEISKDYKSGIFFLPGGGVCGTSVYIIVVRSHRATDLGKT